MPSAYVLQKLLTNPTRTPAFKKEKDIESIRELLIHIKQSNHDTKRVLEIFNSLTVKEQTIIKSVCVENFIELGL